MRLEDGRILRGEDFRVPARAPRKIVIGGDNDTPELLAEACREAQLLVHEATYTAEVAARLGPAPMHSCARRVASFAAAAGLPNLILTHFSPRYADGGKGLTVRDLAREAGEQFKGRLHLARDLDLFELDPEGGLELAGAA